MIASSTLQRTLIVILCALLAAIGAILVTSVRPTPSSAPAASSSPFLGPTLPPGLRAANFSLRDPSGQLVSLSQYRGHVVVLTFIHSQCRDACPLMVEQIKGALNDLPDSGRAVPVIGISVAPAEDTVAHRRTFLAQHEMAGRLAFLNGPPSAIRRVWHAYAIQPVTPKIDHSTFVMLIDKRGYEVVGFAADQLTPEALAHDVGVLERRA